MAAISCNALQQRSQEHQYTYVVEVRRATCPETRLAAMPTGKLTRHGIEAVIIAQLQLCSMSLRYHGAVACAEAVRQAACMEDNYKPDDNCQGAQSGQ